MNIVKIVKKKGKFVWSKCVECFKNFPLGTLNWYYTIELNGGHFWNRCKCGERSNKNWK